MRFRVYPTNRFVYVPSGAGLVAYQKIFLNEIQWVSLKAKKASMLCAVDFRSPWQGIPSSNPSARGGGVGWFVDDDVLCTWTHVTCYATEMVVGRGGDDATRDSRKTMQNSGSLALGKHRRSKVTKVEKSASFGLWKKTWLCHATRNYRRFCNRMCLVLTGTWRRRDLLVSGKVIVRKKEKHVLLYTTFECWSVSIVRFRNCQGKTSSTDSTENSVPLFERKNISWEFVGTNL